MKKNVKITKQEYTFEGFGSTYNLKIPFNSELQADRIIDLSKKF